MQPKTHAETSDRGTASRLGPSARIAWARCRQVVTVGFVVVTTTILIQNIAYPEWLEPWKKTFRALTGSAIFFIGFSVARVLYVLYAEEIRAIRTSRAMGASRAPEASGTLENETSIEKSSVSYDGANDESSSDMDNVTDDEPAGKPSGADSTAP